MTSFPLLNMSMKLLKHLPSFNSETIPTLQLCLLIMLLKMFYSNHYFWNYKSLGYF